MKNKLKPKNSKWQKKKSHKIIPNIDDMWCLSPLSKFFLTCRGSFEFKVKISQETSHCLYLITNRRWLFVYNDCLKTRECLVVTQCQKFVHTLGHSLPMECRSRFKSTETGRLWDRVNKHRFINKSCNWLNVNSC